MDAKAIFTVDLPLCHPRVGRAPSRGRFAASAIVKLSSRGNFGPAAGYLPRKETAGFGQYRRSNEAGAGLGRTLAENPEHLSGVTPDIAPYLEESRSGAETAERAKDWKSSPTNERSAGATWKYAQSVAAIRDGAVSHPGGAEEMHGHADY